jgi:hypothetical protein
MENLFISAIRGKFRFPFKGLVNVEDSFDMSVRDLDLVFKSLNSELKQVKEESLLDLKTQQDKELDMKIEIVKYIVSVKLEEESLRLKAKEKKEQKQKLLELLAEKQDESLKGKSIEEIKAMLEELGD